MAVNEVQPQYPTPPRYPTPPNQCQAGPDWGSEQMEQGQSRWPGTTLEQEEEKKQRSKWMRFRRLFRARPIEEGPSVEDGRRLEARGSGFKRFIMGKLNIFKKFGEKSKAPEENPYQAQPAGDQSTSGQPPQTQSGGFSNAGSPLPPYSESASTSEQTTPPPGYHTTPSSTSARSGYVSQTLGAQYGVGRAQRFDTVPAPGQSQQNSYGGLDAQDGRLFSPSYGPPKQTTGPPYPQHSSYDGMPTSDGREHELTEDEIVNAKKAEANFIRNQTLEKSQQVLGQLDQALDKLTDINATVDRQDEMLAHAEAKLYESETSTRIAALHTKDLRKVQSLASTFGDKRRLKSKNEAIQNARIQNEADKEMLRQDWAMRSTAVADVARNAESQAPKVLGANSTKAQLNRERFMIEDDDGSQEAVEVQIGENLAAISLGTGKLHQLALVTNAKLANSNEIVSRMSDKAERVQERVHKGRIELESIR
ncbi:hypothetical protein VTK26DRAFT_6947 [Humicola hyalothermophila]